MIKPRTSDLQADAGSAYSAPLARETGSFVRAVEQDTHFVEAPLPVGVGIACGIADLGHAEPREIVRWVGLIEFTFEAVDHI